MNWLSWLRRPVTIWALAGLALLLAVPLVPLSLAARQNPLATAGPPDIVVCLSFAVVGLVVAWYRPGNPIGWLMLVLAVSILFYIDAGFYDVIGYRSGHRLPFAPVVLFLYEIQQPVLGLLPLVILLFPDGRLPSPRWRWLVYGYLTVGLADVIVLAQMSVYAITAHRTQVDTSGALTVTSRADRVLQAPAALVFFVLWVLAVGYQVVSWRRAVGGRRQQLNWLMAGGAAALVSFLAAIAANAPLLLPHSVRLAIGEVLLVGVAALPTGMGVAILRYRLYEIERIISRTLAYAIVTGLLVGVYAGLVLLATRVLSVHTPVAVAASTLAAAALFTPLRRRVQRVVDRRFNRVRYDGDRMVAAFAVRLKDAVELDMVRADLAGVVSQALEPTHVSVWINQRG